MLSISINPFSFYTVIHLVNEWTVVGYHHQHKTVLRPSPDRIEGLVMIITATGCFNLILHAKTPRKQNRNL